MNTSELVLLFIGIIAGAIGLSLLMSYPVMLLWNGCAVPAITGLHEIGWLQAWGLTILTACLFKSSSVSKK